MPETKTKPLMVELSPEIRQRLEWLAQQDARRLETTPSLAGAIRRLINAEWQARQTNAGRKK